MNTLLETARFSRTYFARYWFRFVLGVVLGIFFGFSNGLFMGSVYLITSRLADSGHVSQEVHDGRIVAQNPTVAPKSETKLLKEKFYVAIDPWLPRGDRSLDWKQCLGVMFLLPFAVILRGFLGYGNSYLMAWAGQRITNDVKTDAFRKISSLSLDFFQKTTTSELIARIETDGSNLNAFLKLGLCDLVKEPVTILSALGTMLWIDWKFTLIALGFAPLCIIPTRMVMKRVKDLTRRDFNNAVGQSSITMESFQNVRITKAYSLEDVHADAFRKNGLRSAYFVMKQIQSREMLNPIVQTLVALGISAVILYAIWTHCRPETLVTFIAALVFFNTSFKKLNGLGVFFTNMTVSLERLMALFKMQPTVCEAANPLPMREFTRSLEFRHVDFSYGDSPVLQDINFTLARGQRLGLAGESGSGKSSLLNLLFRFYDPTSGVIEIDSVPIQDLRLGDLRFHLALVSQDILLFNATVAENIAYGKIGATRDEIIAAAREAYAHDFISALPQGYDTPLGERGTRLSGGQRQRIAIARAFVRNAPILVLDEATASLDSQAEAEVQNAIDHLAEHRTVVCVAHRLSTLRSMDNILVLEKGRIVEQGSFNQLLAQRGLFTAMAARQSIFPQAA